MPIYNMPVQTVPVKGNFSLNFSPVKLANTISNLNFKGKGDVIPAFEHSLEFTPVNDTFEKEDSAIEKGIIIKPDGEVFNRHDTSLCRTDVKWQDLAQYLDERFKDEEHINTYQYASSFGKEAYGLAITLDKELGKASEKFFPIDAKDLSRNVIERNKKDQETGKIQITGDDAEHCYSALKFLFCPDKYDEYIEEDGGKFFIKGDHINNVNFSQANILEDIDNINPISPSFVMCRNMWPYVDDSEYQDFADKLYERLAPGSCVMLGDYDYTKIGYRKNFPEALIEAGFEPSNTGVNEYHELIFEKN